MTDELFESIAEEPELVEAEVAVIPSDDETAAKGFDEAVAESLGQEPEVKAEDQPAWALTEEQFNAVVEKANRYDELAAQTRKVSDQAFGKLGQLEQTLKSFQQQKAEPIPLSAESFKALTEYFGDADLAEALAKDLSGISLGQSAPTQTIDFDAMNQGLDERFSALNQDFELKLLSISHPDWRSIKEKPEFEEWRHTLKPDALETLDSTWEGNVLAQAFTSFKNWENKKVGTAKEKEKRLAAAIPIKGVAGGQQRTIEEDAFTAGLKSVLAGRK